MILKCIELSSRFVFIAQCKRYEAVCERSILDSHWSISITEGNKQVSIFNFDGALTNESVAQLIYDNLFLL